jgi:hypothetical protein
VVSPKATNPGPPPLLFGFRGIRLLQVILAIATLAVAIGGLAIILEYSAEHTRWLLALAVLFGVLFIWMFGLTLRLPTSFVAISPERMRIRFGGFVDTVVDVRDVVGVRLVTWPAWKGLGVRTSFQGDVALVAAGGVAAELTLRNPINVWLIPRLWRVRARKVVMSVRNPQKMVERFGPPPANAVSPKRKARR